MRTKIIQLHETNLLIAINLVVIVAIKKKTMILTSMEKLNRRQSKSMCCNVNALLLLLLLFFALQNLYYIDELFALFDLILGIPSDMYTIHIYTACDI